MRTAAQATSESLEKPARYVVVLPHVAIFGLALYSCLGFVLDLALAHIVQKIGLLHLGPSAQGRIRSTRVRLGIMN